MPRQNRSGNSLIWERQVRAYLNDLDGRSITDRGDLATALKPIEGEEGRIEIENGDGVAGNPTVTLGDFPTISPTVVAGETANIPVGHQMIVNDEFYVDGDLDIEPGGELVILDMSHADWSLTKTTITTGESFRVPDLRQLIVWDSFSFDGGTLTLDGDLIIL